MHNFGKCECYTSKISCVLRPEIFFLNSAHSKMHSDQFGNVKHGGIIRNAWKRIFQLLYNKFVGSQKEGVLYYVEIIVLFPKKNMERHCIRCLIKTVD